MKTCTKCGFRKALIEFPYRNQERNIFQSYCKSCQNAYSKTHYEANKEYYISKAPEYRRKIVLAVNMLKEAVPCADCGQYYPSYVMHFDHLRDKEFAVSRMISDTKSLESILEEITKCEIVCANCHAVRTHNRLPSVV
jgi:hypothetical protein